MVAQRDGALAPGIRKHPVDRVRFGSHFALAGHLEDGRIKGQGPAVRVSFLDEFLPSSELALDTGPLGLEVALALPVRLGRFVLLIGLTAQLESLVSKRPCGSGIAVRCRLSALQGLEDSFLLQPRTEFARVAEVHIDAGYLPPLGLGTFVMGHSLLFGLACRRLRFRGVVRQGPLSLALRRGASHERRFEVCAHSPQRVASRLQVGMLRIDRLAK